MVFIFLFVSFELAAEVLGQDGGHVMWPVSGWASQKGDWIWDLTTKMSDAVRGLLLLCRVKACVLAWPMQGPPLS